MSSQTKSISWIWWPLVAIWRLVTTIIELTGRFIAILLGFVLLVAGGASAITSVSQEAVRLGRENNIAVVPGGCPMMFCEPVDFGHKCMCGVLRVTGSPAV